MKKVSQIVIKEDRWYTLTGAAGLVVEAAEGEENGAAIVLGTYSHDPRQEWGFVRVGEGVYCLKNRGTGKMMDLMMGGSADGTWLHQWEEVGASSQMWILEPTNDGRMVVKSQLAPNRCLDVVDMSAVEGARLQIWQEVSGENQFWTVAAVVEKRTRKAATKAEAAPAEEAAPAPKKTTRKKAAAKAEAAPAEAAPAAKKTTRKKAAAKTAEAPAEAAAPKKTTRKKAAKKTEEAAE